MVGQARWPQVMTRPKEFWVFVGLRCCHDQLLLNSCWGPLVGLKGFHPSIIRWCLMHALHLGLLYTANGGTMPLACMHCCLLHACARWANRCFVIQCHLTRTTNHTHELIRTAFSSSMCFGRPVSLPWSGISWSNVATGHLQMSPPEFTCTGPTLISRPGAWGSGSTAASRPSKRILFLGKILDEATVRCIQWMALPFEW